MKIRTNKKKHDEQNTTTRTHWNFPHFWFPQLGSMFLTNMFAAAFIVWFKTSANCARMQNKESNVLCTAFVPKKGEKLIHKIQNNRIPNRYKFKRMPGSEIDMCKVFFWCCVFFIAYGEFSFIRFCCYAVEKWFERINTFLLCRCMTLVLQ